MPKVLTFLGSSLKDLKQFPRDALHDAGTELRRVQYVIHAFQKKTQKTAKPDLELGQTRFRQLMRDKK
jgi:phage-related protein